LDCRTLSFVPVHMDSWGFCMPHIWSFVCHGFCRPLFPLGFVFLPSHIVCCLLWQWVEWAVSFVTSDTHIIEKHFQP
jgi:hypothetical protein